VSRIVVVGDVMLDVVARLSGPVAVGSDSEASVSFGGGGSAANVAAWLAFAGAPAVFVGRVGSDHGGVSAADELRAGGVDARLVVDGEHPTGTCVVLVGPGGERSMLPDPGANAFLSPDDLPDSVLEAGGHLHVTGYSLVRLGPRPAALAAIARAAAAGMSVSVDPSSAALLGREFLELLEGVGLVLPNAEEAEAVTGLANPAEAARSLASRIPEVVVKLGAEGALWTDGSNEERVPAVVVAAAVSGPLDTTGAGDAFAAGLLAARLRGASPAEALRAGCELAARAVVTPGARPPAPA
jgi:sugar/nucleoside kinase (ribokinase family)